MCVDCHGNPHRVSNVPHGPSAKFQVENGNVCMYTNVVICQKWGSQGLFQDFAQGGKCKVPKLRGSGASTKYVIIDVLKILGGGGKSTPWALAPP